MSFVVVPTIPPTEVLANDIRAQLVKFLLLTLRFAASGLATVAFNCVWIEEVTPDTYPNSVEVTEDATGIPFASDTRAFDAVIAVAAANAVDPV